MSATFFVVVCWGTVIKVRHTNRLIKHQEHLVAYIEGSEPPEKVESAQVFLVHNLCAGGPLQLVQGDSQVTVGLDNIHIGSINADRKWGACSS